MAIDFSALTAGVAAGVRSAERRRNDEEAKAREREDHLNDTALRRFQLSQQMRRSGIARRDDPVLAPRRFTGDASSPEGLAVLSFLGSLKRQQEDNVESVGSGPLPYGLGRAEEFVRRPWMDVEARDANHAQAREESDRRARRAAVIEFLQSRSNVNEPEPGGEAVAEVAARDPALARAILTADRSPAFSDWVRREEWKREHPRPLPQSPNADAPARRATRQNLAATEGQIRGIDREISRVSADRGRRLPLTATGPDSSAWAAKGRTLDSLQAERGQFVARRDSLVDALRGGATAPATPSAAGMTMAQLDEWYASRKAALDKRGADESAMRALDRAYHAKRAMIRGAGR